MAENAAFIAFKAIGLSTVGGRRPCTLLGAARHNLREIQAEMGATGHIDPERSRANVILAGPNTAAEVQEGASFWMSCLIEGHRPLRKDHVQCLEFVFSLPAGCGIDVESYFGNCLGWLEAELKLPVLSAAIHRDEAAPHMHVLLMPVNNEGRHVGGAPINGGVTLRRLRASFFDSVAGPAGLKREGAKMRGQAKDWAISAIIKRCEDMDMPDACGPLWPVLRAAIERDPVAALTALEIDPDTIRPAQREAAVVSHANPIGFEDGHVANPSGFEATLFSPSAKPIGFEKEQTQSCVGFAFPDHAETHREPAAQHPPEHQPIATLAELWECVGRRSVWRTIRAAPAPTASRPQQRKTARHYDRVEAGGRAMQQAVLRGGARVVNATIGRVGTPPQRAASGDGWTRDREDVNEPEPWADW